MPARAGAKSRFATLKPHHLSIVGWQMPSTAIADIEYDPDRRLLRVTFVTGRIYVYEDVPIDAFEALMSAGSRGAYFNRHIRGAYEYREVC
jgi:hypothetical protein